MIYLRGERSNQVATYTASVYGYDAFRKSTRMFSTVASIAGRRVHRQTEVEEEQVAMITQQVLHDHGVSSTNYPST